MPLPLVLGALRVLAELRKTVRRPVREAINLSSKPRLCHRFGLCYAATSKASVARPPFINALLYSTSAAATIRVANTHVNKNTLSDS